MFIFSFLFSCNIFAQVSETIDYYPLRVNDRYYYYKASDCPSPTTTIYSSTLFLIRRITDSLIINNLKYYIGWINQRRPALDTFRVDGNKNIIILRQTKEQIFYKLNANVGDSWSFIDTIGTMEWNYKITLQSKTDKITVYAGTFTNCYKFHFQEIHSRGNGFDDWLAPNVGLIARCIQEPFELGKAIIDGKEYSLTSVSEEINPDISLKICQNYPNPFNPTTNIKYQVPTPGFVILKVYDVLGREVAMLVNENKNPGAYSIQFDGSKLSSGTYYYRLEVTPLNGDKKITIQKSMILMK